MIGGSLSSVRLLFAALDARRRRTQAACLNRRIGRANFHHDSRPRDNNPQNYDFFEGTTAIKCIHIPSGRLVWDTDAPPLLEEYKKQDFYERNFSYSSAPLVAAIYHPAMAPVGLLLAVLGNVAGTYLGLAVAQLLSSAG